MKNVLGILILSCSIGCLLSYDKMVDKGTGRYLSDTLKDDKYVIYTSNSSNYTFWDIKVSEAKYYVFQSKSSSNCLDSNAENQVFELNCNGNFSQTWVKYNENSYTYFYNRKNMVIQENTKDGF